MKISKIISTSRGSIYFVNCSIADSISNFILFDWPFATGLIAFKKANQAHILDAFNWSLKNGYIEEDATMHSAIYALNYNSKKEIKTTLYTAMQLPILFDLSKEKFFSILSNSNYDDVLTSLDVFSFPLGKDYTNCVYPIVNSLELLHTLCKSGVSMIQLRIKDNFGQNLDKDISLACEIVSKFPRTKFFINDHWELAIKHDAFGIHLGQEDILKADMKKISKSGLHLGISTHSYWEVGRALRYGPSYVACGPIFPTRVKKMPWKNQGLNNLTFWSKILNFPVIAIGGIKHSNIDVVAKTGCQGVSLINAINDSKDPVKSFKALSNIWEKNNLR